MSIILGRLIKKSNNKKYVKIKRNQLIILDALLDHGGQTKKYIDSSKNMRYSEHSGNFGLTESTIDRIIISAKTFREDKDDTEILLPNDLSDSYNYKYFFHTHPPTPHPGGRVSEGIIYEFPSISDIFHFIDHYNMGNTLGSIVVTPEGYYIIYPSNFSIKKITYDIEIEEEIYNKMNEENIEIQATAIKKFGYKFSEDFFYNKIATNTTFLKIFNKMINKYLNGQIKIIIKHRTKDILSDKWILKQLYLPI